MNHYSSRARGVAYTLITGTFASIAAPSADVLAQDAAAPAASATSASPAASSRRERRRTAQAETAAAPAATTATAAPASAVPSAAATPAAATAAAAEGPTTICKNIKPLGTRMAKRVCGTPEQWAALEKKTTDAASDDMRQVRSISGVIATTPGPTSTP